MKSEGGLVRHEGDQQEAGCQRREMWEEDQQKQIGSENLIMKSIMPHINLLKTIFKNDLIHNLSSFILFLPQKLINWHSLMYHF